VTSGQRILITIPIFNEIRYVGRVLEQLREIPHDKLFIDDGSTDGTRDVLEAAAARGEIAVLPHPRNMGYGQSLIDGFNYAQERGYDWAITMDCDEQHDPAAIPCFVREIEKDDADIVSGSRYLRPARGDDCYQEAYPGDDLPPPERRAVNLIVTATLNHLFGWELTDSFCGFKAHRVRPTAELELTEPGYAFPLQLWPRAQSAGLRIREIPVRLIYNDVDRTFGHDVRAGDLDNARVRLGHYLEVLSEELCEKNLPKLSGVEREVLESLPAGIPDPLRTTLRESYEAAAAIPCP
jgi:dolichol-phosphate mannosyltransferase